MGLNILATRKYDLDDFAEGWEGAHVIVVVPNAARRQEYVTTMSALNKDMDKELTSVARLPTARQALANKDIVLKYDERADAIVTATATDIITAGKVVTTNEDGSTELVSFAKEDVADVVAALGFAWLNDIVTVAFGNDRLKAKN